MTYLGVFGCIWTYLGVFVRICKYLEVFGRFGRLFKTYLDIFSCDFGGEIGAKKGSKRHRQALVEATVGCRVLYFYCTSCFCRFSF